MLSTMDHRPTQLERAFQLAKSGRYGSVDEIRNQLRSEGYFETQISGNALTRQLRGLSKQRGGQKGAKRSGWLRSSGERELIDLALRIFAAARHAPSAAGAFFVGTRASARSALLLRVTESYKINLFSFDGTGQNSIRCCGGARSRDASRWASGLGWQS
jgi:hypothetical protein